MKDKIIFLDFDGVITIPPHWNLNLDKIKNLKKIVDATNAKIVVSSSWRAMDVETTKSRILVNNNNKILNWFKDNIYDITPIAGYRGEEIQRWIDSHDIENYVIIDDDTDMLDSQIMNFVQTNYEFGLTEQQVNLAIKVLNKERIINPLGLNFTANYAWFQKCNGHTELYNKIFKKDN